MNNVRGKIIDTECSKKSHCGKEGYWLEKQMGIVHNSNNIPDIGGFEMKKYSNKITFGDFSASEYIFSKKKIYITAGTIERDEFIKYFGTPNPLKNNRYSWSGMCVPTYKTWNTCGQTLRISNDNHICIYYSFSKDTRDIKNTFPEFLKTDKILIAMWHADKMREHINNKFNINGFFICKKGKNTYETICFGDPFNFESFIENIKKKIIIFDSGMYEGNKRNYSQFRASGNFWNTMITSSYP